MIASLLAEILGSARRLTATIVVLIVAIYVSGFIIVNAYLWKFGIARLEFFQPPFLAAGLLFVFIGIVATLFILPLIVPMVSPLLELAHSLYESKQGVKGLWLTIGLAVTCTILATGVFAVGLFLLEVGASEFVAILLGLTTGLPLPVPSDVRSSLEIIMRLHGIASSMVLLLLNHQRSLGPVPRSVAIWLAGATFLFVQIYTLLTFSGNLYERLPVSFGGGRPAQVIFLIEPKNVQKLKELDIPFLSENTSATNADQLMQLQSELSRTQELQLIWQLGSETTEAETVDSLSTYVVRTCERCRAVEIRKALVYGIIHAP